MKHLLLVLIVIGIGIFTYAQSDYEVGIDSGAKMLKGVVKRDLLENDTAFAWFHQNQAGYTPNTDAVSLLRAKGGCAQFGGPGGST